MVAKSISLLLFKYLYYYEFFRKKLKHYPITDSCRKVTGEKVKQKFLYCKLYRYKFVTLSSEEQQEGGCKG